jgi:catechol-2,3-dioxygenase
MSMTIDFDAPSEKVRSPSMLAHVVLRTTRSNFKAMVDFYLTSLGGTVTYANDFMSFLTYDEEHHRIAIVALPDATPKNRTSSGLDHIAFTFPTLADLMLSYRQRKAKGIVPEWSINHGYAYRAGEQRAERSLILYPT